MKQKMQYRFGAFFLCVSLMLALSACGMSESPVQRAQDALSLDFQGPVSTVEEETHGGFHGDGYTYTVVTFLENPPADQIAESSDWKKLPLDETLMALIYGVQGDGWSQGPYLAETSGGQPLFPEIQNGYYFFLDRHKDSANPKDSEGLLDRASVNCTIALYDTDADTLYFCEYDS